MVGGESADQDDDCRGAGWALIGTAHLILGTDAVLRAIRRSSLATPRYCCAAFCALVLAASRRITSTGDSAGVGCCAGSVSAIADSAVLVRAASLR
jgi:hypothetical protein